MKQERFYALCVRECEGCIDEENHIAYHEDQFDRWVATDIQSGLVLMRDVVGYATCEEFIEHVMSLMEEINKKRSALKWQYCVDILQTFIKYRKSMTECES